MPLRKSFTDSSGTNYPTAIWVVNTLSLNPVAETVSFSMLVYPDATAFSSRDSYLPDSPILFTINNSTTFRAYFSVVRGVDNAFALISQCANYVGAENIYGFTATGNYMDSTGGGGSVRFSPTYITACVAAQDGPDVVTLTLNNDVTTAGTFQDGVTIKVNGSPAAISSVAHPSGPVLRYTLSAPILMGDVVEFEGRAVSMVDVNLDPVIIQDPTSIGNYVGRILDLRQQGHAQLNLAI